LRGRPRPGLPLVRLPPPPEFLSPTGSAFAAPGAPPSPFRPAWGLSRRADSRDARFRETLSWSSAPLQSSSACLPPALLLRPVRRSDRSVSRVRDPPLLGFLLPRTQRRRVPRFTALRRDASRWTRDRRSLAGAVLRVLAPLDGSGCTSRRSVPLAEHAVGRDAPTLGGLIPCRSRSWSRPSELFPSRGAVPALAGRCFLAGSRSTAAWRDVLEGFTTAFPAAPTLCRSSPSRACWTEGP